MENKKIIFSHFETVSGEKTNSIQIYLGNLNINEWLDDVEVQLDIIDGDVKFTILNQHYYDKGELSGIKKELKFINWDNGYEFFDLYDFSNKKNYFLVADRNSECFNLINSDQNKKNIDNFLNNIKNNGLI